jgi:hypothetical protein
MSSSIRISDETKRKLEARMRDGETYDELLERLARTEKDVDEMGGWLDEDEADAVEEHVEQKREGLSESIERRKERTDDRS